MRASDLRARLVAARTPDAAWAYRAGEPSRVEPTCYALLALAATGDPAPSDALRWLVAAQNADGSWGGTDTADAAWVTGPAVFTLATLRAAPATRMRGIEWLLGTRSQTRDYIPGIGADPKLVGWPWAAGSFGWVEPTAHALLALRASGVQHPRVTDAFRFLLDRRCTGGGWNYGTVRVLDVDLAPLPQPTAVAAMALAQETAPPGMQRDLAVLATFLEAPRGVFDLAAIALALDAWESDATLALAHLDAAIDAGGVWHENVHALALATLAMSIPADTNPFRPRG